MSIESIGGLTPRRADALASADQPSANSDQTRARLKQLAAEFESMLLLQMLKEMRKSGSWEEKDDESGGYGAETMLETIDVELASHLSKVQGFGLAKQLMKALDPLSADAQASALRTDGVERGLPPSPSLRRTSQPARDIEPARDIQSDSIEMPEGDVTSAYGWRRDPIDGASKFHRGIDIRAAYGQDIQAAAGGRVVSAGQEGSYGETVVIEHAGGLRTRYAHLSSGLVTPGQEVAAGQVVGRAGRSGRATGTHLHFEVTTATGDRVDPAIFARFKAEAMVADLTGGTSPATAPSALRRDRLSEETRK